MSSMNNNLYEPYISRYMSVDINGNWAPRTINKEQTILYIFVSAAAAQTLDIEKFAQHKSEAFVCCFPFLLLSVSRRMRKNPSVMRRAPCVTPHTQRPKSSIQFGMRSSLNFLSVSIGFCSVPRSQHQWAEKRMEQNASEDDASGTHFLVTQNRLLAENFGLCSYNKDAFNRAEHDIFRVCRWKGAFSPRMNSWQCLLKFRFHETTQRPIDPMIAITRAGKPNFVNARATSPWPSDMVVWLMPQNEDIMFNEDKSGVLCGKAARMLASIEWMPANNADGAGHASDMRLL